MIDRSILQSDRYVALPSSGRQAWSDHHILTLLILSCLLQSVPPAHLVIAASLLDLRNVQLYNM